MTAPVAFAAAVALVLACADALALVAGRGASRRSGSADPPRWLRRTAVIGRLLGAPVSAGRLERLRASAGLPETVEVSELTAAKAGAALSAVLLALLASGGGGLRTTATVAVAAGTGGFLIPDLWLRRRARARSAIAALELPAVLELLRVAVGSGLTVGRALEEVGARGSGVVASELRALARRAELGEPRERALVRLRERLPLPEVELLAAAIERAERHGTPLGPALGALAIDARAGRARRMQERGARAAPRMQLAIALLLVPAVLTMVASVVIASV